MNDSNQSTSDKIFLHRSLEPTIPNRSVNNNYSLVFQDRRAVYNSDNLGDIIAIAASSALQPAADSSR